MRTTPVTGSASVSPADEPVDGVGHGLARPGRAAAERGELPAVGALDQEAPAEGAFQRGDVAGDGGVVDAERLRRRRVPAGAGDLQQHQELVGDLAGRRVVAGWHAVTLPTRGRVCIRAHVRLPTCVIAAHTASGNTRASHTWRASAMPGRRMLGVSVDTKEQHVCTAEHWSAGRPVADQAHRRRLDGRHGRRVVRLLPLRDRVRARVQQGPHARDGQRVRRDHRGVRDLRRGLPRPPARRRRLRPHRRQGSGASTPCSSRSC